MKKRGQGEAFLMSVPREHCIDGGSSFGRSSGISANTYTAGIIFSVKFHRQA
jgi:hypothetical protein